MKTEPALLTVRLLGLPRQRRKRRAMRFRVTLKQRKPAVDETGLMRLVDEDGVNFENEVMISIFLYTECIVCTMESYT